VLLEADGPSALRELRRALGTLLGALAPMGRPVDLAQRLALDPSLAWKIWRVAQGPGELPSPKHVPGRAAMATFLDGARRGGAGQETIQAVREAHARLERVFKQHAGDRASAEILLGRFTDEGRVRLESQLRREAFRANSHVLGVRARTRYQLDVVVPSRGPYMPQLARVRGWYGLQRTRTDARWVLSRSFMLQSHGRTERFRRAALAGGDLPAGAEGPAPLAPAFCSPADPPVQRTRSADGVIVDELGPGPIGEAGASDIVTAERLSEIPADDVDRDVLGVHVRTPSERLCYEVLLHRDIAGDALPTIDVFTTLNAESLAARPDPRDRIPMLDREAIRSLGAADTAPPAVEVPHHAALCSWVLERLGAEARDYLVFRSVMRFPPIPTLVWVTYRLPRRAPG
jgi:hypothetical protein